MILEVDARQVDVAWVAQVRRGRLAGAGLLPPAGGTSQRGRQFILPCPCTVCSVCRSVQEGAQLARCLLFPALLCPALL